MAWLSMIARELFGLFVEDVPFTAAIIGWIVVAAFGLPLLAIDAQWDAPLLAAGCALLLIASSRRAAQRHRRQRDAGL